MEELFRKAAENYEVDTEKASDWEKVHTGVHGNDNSPDSNDNAKGKKKRRFIFWWFLLFPAGWIAHNAWNDNMGRPTSGKKGDGMVQQHPFTNEHATPPESGNNTNAGDEKTAGTTIINPGETNHSSLTSPLTGNALLEQVPLNNSAPHNQVKQGSNKARQSNNKGNRSAAPDRNHEQGNQFDQAESGNMQDKAGDVFMGLSYTPALTLQKIPGNKISVLPPLTVEKHLDYNPAVKESGSLSAGTAANAVEAKPPAPPSNNKYFYVQALVAPDISTVKFQKVAGLGYSTGLLFGYRFNKNWQVETGAFWERKWYYTKGEYFDKSKQPYLNNVDLYSVDGNCGMINIPLTVRYNINTGKNNDWFITAGMSSYLMTNEYYDYTYEHYGNVYTKGYSYKKNSQEWLTTVNISAGYERKLGKSFQLRIEPYFRIPVSGIGTGNLLLNSGGLYIGIGKRLN
ncbi:MAG TPA: porin family protein [Agriterribacter sp.]|nr:porin family protein [Agriterribacter sp.]